MWKVTPVVAVHGKDGSIHSAREGADEKINCGCGQTSARHAVEKVCGPLEVLRQERFIREGAKLVKYPSKLEFVADAT